MKHELDYPRVTSIRDVAAARSQVSQDIEYALRKLREIDTTLRNFNELVRQIAKGEKALPTFEQGSRLILLTLDIGQTEIKLNNLSYQERACFIDIPRILAQTLQGELQHPIQKLSGL